MRGWLGRARAESLVSRYNEAQIRANALDAQIAGVEPLVSALGDKARELLELLCAPDRLDVHR